MSTADMSPYVVSLVVFVLLAWLIVALRRIKAPVLGLYRGLRFEENSPIGIAGLARLPFPSVTAVRYKQLYAIGFISRRTIPLIFANRLRYVLARLGLLRRRIHAAGLLESETARRWRDDDFFVEQFLTLHACEVIALCPALPEADRARILERAPALGQAAAEGRLYILDHTPYLVGTQPFLRPRALLYATRAYIEVRDDRPKLAAIGWDDGLALPGDEGWMAARAMHSHGSLMVCQISLHLFTHVIAEGAAVAMYRKLGRAHPMRDLLTPFIGLVPFVDLGYGKDVIFDSVAGASSLTRAGLEQILRNVQHTTWGYLDAAEHRARRRVEGLPGYVFGQESARFHALIHEGAVEAIEALYPSDAAVVADVELNAWLDDMATHMRWPRIASTREALAHLIGNLMFLATFRHSIYHHRADELYGLTENVPTIIYADGSPPGIVEQYVIEYYAGCMVSASSPWRCETATTREMGIRHPALRGPIDRMMKRYAEAAKGPYAAMSHGTLTH
jgi:hypothetical protein